jgi:hypothetical protein
MSDLLSELNYLHVDQTLAAFQLVAEMPRDGADP